MSTPQLSQTEQMMSDQIRKVYEQTQQGLKNMTDPHTALMFIDTQIRTLRYMLPLTTQLWNFPALAQQISNLLAYLYQIRPDFQALAEKTPPPQGVPGRTPAPSDDEWLRNYAGVFSQAPATLGFHDAQLFERFLHFLPAHSGRVGKRCTLGMHGRMSAAHRYTYCGKQCILTAGHYGPHQCPDGHQWY